MIQSCDCSGIRLCIDSFFNTGSGYEDLALFTVGDHARQTLALDNNFREVSWGCEEPEGRDVELSSAWASVFHGAWCYFSYLSYSSAIYKI